MSKNAASRTSVHDVVRRLRCSGDDEAVECIESLLTMLERFARRGEDLWDREDFRDGYKKIPSGDLVDCRKLIRFFECDQCGGPMRPGHGNVVMVCQDCKSVLASG